MKLKGLLLALLAAIVPHAQGSVWLLGGSPAPTGGGGATLVFSYPSGFATAHSNFTLASGSTIFNDPNIDVVGVGTHEAGAVWYNTKQTITSFTTEFTFKLTNSAWGFNFIIQNDPNGLSASADANGLGYFTYSYNNPDNAIKDSVVVDFNATPNSISGGYYPAASPSVAGLYVDGGPFIDKDILPVQDLSPQSINLNSGDLMDVLLTYDGTNLQMLVMDTTSGAKATFSWPVNIPSIVGASTAYVGFGAGCVSSSSCGPATLNSWTWYSSYNSELSAPTFSPTPGQYTSSQTVSLSGPAGATIYYTTNGKPPNTSSSTYSTPITVSANEAIQAIAVKSGYTNSSVGLGNYLIQSAGSPTINFPSGFSGTGLIQTAGMAAISGSNLVITDGVTDGEIGSAFYVAPVSISSFTTNFTFDWTPSSNGAHNGVTFLLMNPGLGTFNGVLIPLASAPSSGATSALLSSAWSETTGPINIEFSDGSIRSTSIANGATTVSWTGGLANSVAAYFLIARTTPTAVTGGPYSIGGGAYAAGNAYGAMGIGNSVGVVFDEWSGTVGFSLDGALPTSTSITGVNLGKNPDQVTLTYSGTTLSLTLKDTVTLATFTDSWTVNIGSEIGAGTAYVGFTGGSYDSGVSQDISIWTGF